jgi:rod shape-determining protein MreD
MTIKQWMILLFSLLIGFGLAILPLPNWASWFRPEWLALLIIFWLLADSYHLGFALAWGVGLTLDVLQGGFLGVNALAMTLIAYPVIKFHRQLRSFPLWLQTSIIVGLLLMYRLVIVVAHGMLGDYVHYQHVVLPVITSGLLWPWLYMLLTDLNQHARA